jgi:signal transduction histidine kinase
MPGKLRVLIVEDNERDAALLMRELKRGGFDLDWERVDTPEAMNEALERQTWQLVVSDYAMPRFSASAALAIVKNRGIDVPFIIVSGTVGEETAVEAMRSGAHDFMPKGKFTRLIPAIKRELREAAVRAERAAIELQLQRAQKMEALGQLTGGIAHDFNNLLGVIIGNIDLLLETLPPGSEQVEWAEAALNSAMRGGELTRRLLAFARRQPMHTQLVQLNERLPEMIAVLRRTLGEGISIEAALDEGLWATRVDPSRVEDALLNLAINARDAMPEGGTLLIETANRALDQEAAQMFTDVEPGDYVVLSITDTGTGMPPEVVERALEPFFTTKEPGRGTGLGLSMVYGFARQSGGHLNIYSEVGVGTTIRLYLPRALAVGEQGSGEAERAKPLASGGERILVVDDNAELRRVVVRLLSSLGYRVAEAGSGPEALALLDAGEGYDLLYTDVGLPGGMNGYELASEARIRRPDIKLVFTTGYAKIQPADQIGLGPLLRKPCRAHEIAGTIREVLDGEIG